MNPPYLFLLTRLEVHLATAIQTILLVSMDIARDGALMAFQRTRSVLCPFRLYQRLLT